MTQLLFIATLVLMIFAMLFWGFRFLPRERWQILASLPGRPEGEGSWQGINLTWYGLLSANAYVVAVAVLWVLLRSVGVTPLPLLLYVLALLGLCVPAARWVAMLVEKKKHTFTVGGAVFVGLLAAPWIAVLINSVPGLGHLPVLPLLAALGIAYSFGEGLGRLACISFGCCYGRPLQELPAWVQRLFKRWHFVFQGATKKIAYASGLAGTGVLPIQGITAILYALTGLVGTACFLQGWYSLAFILTTLVTQGWRVYSETLRADWRGAGRLSAYQWMGLAGIPYALALPLLLPAELLPGIDLITGLTSLGHSLSLVLLQLLWIIIFYVTGRSEVTGSKILFHVHHDRI
jgi:prolipoprotein diacylglyceryltransferase